VLALGASAAKRGQPRSDRPGGGGAALGGALGAEGAEV
jgi:hypothetical protein